MEIFHSIVELVDKELLRNTPNFLTGWKITGNGFLKKESNLKLNLMSREYEKVSWDAPFDSSLSQSNVLTFPTICLWWAAQALACLLACFGHPQKNDDDTRCTVKLFINIFYMFPILCHSPLRWHLLPYKRWQKVSIFGLLTCKRSLWMTPNHVFQYCSDL